MTLSPRKLWRLPERSRVGTASLRRSSQLASASFSSITTFFGLISEESHTGIMSSVPTSFCFLFYKARSSSPEKRPSLPDILIIAGVILTTAYYIMVFPTPCRSDRIAPELKDVLFGWFLILVSLEVARRATGNAIPSLVLCYSIYAYFGPYFPPWPGPCWLLPFADLRKAFFWARGGIFGESLILSLPTS